MGLSGCEPFLNTRTLNLFDNCIRLSVVFFGQLPANLIYVEFHLFGGGNRIAELHSTSTKYVERLREMFRGNPLEDIHIE